jgi:hypothetical protein
MRGAICLGVLLGFSCVALWYAPEAEAGAVFSAAGACQWGADVDMRPDTGNQGTVENYETSGIDHRVTCDLATPGHTAAETTDDIFVYYNDVDNGGNMEDSLYCNVYTCSLSGSSACSNEQTLFSCSTGGCVTPPGAWTGSGTMVFSNIDRPSLWVTEVWCAIPTVYSGSRSRVRSMYYIY